MSKKVKEKKNKKNNNKKVKDTIKNKLTKKNIFYILIAIIDVSFIIYCARHNIAHYVEVPSEGHVYIGDSKDLLFGKNYINLVFTSFIYIYILLSNKIFFHIKQSKKNMFILLLIIFIINIAIFFIFTKRIY